MQPSMSLSPVLLIHRGTLALRELLSLHPALHLQIPRWLPAIYLGPQARFRTSGEWLPVC